MGNKYLNNSILKPLQRIVLIDTCLGQDFNKLL